MGKLTEGVNAEISNKDYHADKAYLSSSSLKLILKDLPRFHREHVLGQREPEETKDAYSEGSLVHSLILEPHKVDAEYAMFQGWRKYGAEWDNFVADIANKDKIFISKPQKHRCDRCYAGYLARPAAVNLISGGLPEHTATTSILGVPIKARFDYINVDAGYIVDVKTTAYESGVENFKATIEQFSYELSAALYAQVAHDTYGKLFDFYWLVVSKTDYECHVYKASSDTLMAGHALCNKAIIKYKRALESNQWTDLTSSDSIIISTDDYEVLSI